MRSRLAFLIALGMSALAADARAQPTTNDKAAAEAKVPDRDSVLVPPPPPVGAKKLPAPAPQSVQSAPGAALTQLPSFNGK